MLSISLGPLALPVAPLLLLAALWLAILVARRLAGSEAAQAERAVWGAAVAGLIAARIGHVLMHARPYLDSPWAVLDLRDGGWEDSVGVAVAALWLAERCRTRPGLRRPVVAGSLAGMCAWVLGSVAVLAAGGEAARTPAPDIALAELDGGRTLRLPEALQGRPAVVNLWASWCGPCRAEMPVLDAARRRDTDIRFLLVNQGESAAVVRAYLQREGLSSDGVWLDADKALGPAVGSQGLPTTLFFDAQGRRVHAHLGALNDAALQVRLKQLRER
ncbi:TlpA disulfide reductase family protein [Azohydromonas caseinilytica]|uniref:TlpA family protein disulfide reductase n=1 Tax=Azohydromonas caseinilytica TaxID=2728836 RepID=A0A848FEP5_9BURK|nr:TlpA disulfide reductase family protein [Azohydromonas caseinilytica]NML16620.1 TlpA family protein disulfide reductase [Azohydromonas caseinilytica]